MRYMCSAHQEYWLTAVLYKHGLLFIILQSGSFDVVDDAILTCMLTHAQVLSKAEKRRKRKQEKAAAKALNAQQQPASFATAPSLAPSAQQMAHAKPISPQMTDASHRRPRVSLPSSSSQSPQGRHSPSFGVPVLKPPSASSLKVQTVASADSAATARGPHTPPEQSTPRPSHSPPTPSALPAKHEPKGARTAFQTSTQTVLTKNGQQQQQESHGGEWTRQRSRRRRAQHGQKIQPNQPAQHKKASANRPAKPFANTPANTTAKQGTRGNIIASNKHSQYEPHSKQRQAASHNADLPPKAASLNEAADRHHIRIKPANWVPQSYSAAVGPPSFWADVVTPLVGDEAPIAALLNEHKGSPKYEQLNKLTKGSRPFTTKF